MAECAGGSAPWDGADSGCCESLTESEGWTETAGGSGPRRHKKLDHCTYLEGGVAPNGRNNSVLSFFLFSLVSCCSPELCWSSHLLRVLSVDPRRLLVSIVEPVEEQQQKARGSLKHDAGRWSGGWQAVGWQCGLAHEQLVSQRLEGDTGKRWQGEVHCGKWL